MLSLELFKKLGGVQCENLDSQKKKMEVCQSYYKFTDRAGQAAQSKYFKNKVMQKLPHNW